MTQSLYERIGGEAAVDEAVELLYRKLSDDGHIGAFFDGMERDRIIRKQKAFLTYAFGGPGDDAGQSLREAQQQSVQRGLDEGHLNLVLHSLTDTLREMGVPEELAREAAVLAEEARGDARER